MGVWAVLLPYIHYNPDNRNRQEKYSRISHINLTPCTAVIMSTALSIIGAFRHSIVGLVVVEVSQDLSGGFG